EAERWYADVEPVIGDHLPRAGFQAWLRLNMAKDRPSAERWAALQALIGQWQPAVVEGRDRRAADDEEKRRLARLRQLDAEISRCEERIRQLTTAREGDREAIRDEIAALRERV